jgi:predicted GNAT family N-acyltransferase
MIQGKILSSKDDLNEVFNIRREVNIEELKIPEEHEFDEHDSSAVHVIVYENEQTNRDIKIPVATGRLLFLNEVCFIEKIAVLKKYRRRNYGDFAVRMLINRAFMAGVNQVFVNIPESKEQFFGKIGFVKINEYISENGIHQCKMIIKYENFVPECQKKGK